jgi:hypothetical protein
LASALVTCEFSASRPGRFIPGERTTGTHWIEGLVGDMEKLKFLLPPGLELRRIGRPARSQEALCWYREVEIYTNAQHNVGKVNKIQDRQVARLQKVRQK